MFEPADEEQSDAMTTEDEFKLTSNPGNEPQQRRKLANMNLCRTRTQRVETFKPPKTFISSKNKTRQCS